MNILSKSSIKKLETCDVQLQEIVNAVTEIMPIQVIEGKRSKRRQDRLFAIGRSKLQWPDSKHNVEEPDELAKAVDIAPKPIDWNDMERFFFLAGVMFGVGGRLNIKVRWGGDWNQNLDFKDQNFRDLVHFELVEEKKT